MGLAILVHDASHHALFKSKRLNHFMGKWFATAPILQDLALYRTYHLQHHNYTGQSYRNGKGDPDLLIVRFYPVSQKTMRKWLLKDLLGNSGSNIYLGLFLMIIGKLKFDLSGRVTRLEEPKMTLLQRTWRYTRRLFPFFFTNGLMLAILALSGYAWLYLLWLASGFTTFSVFLRIRAIAEHGVLERTDDYFRNTRTVIARWFERMTVAPHFVNYHLEHHVLMNAPSYKLPKLHRILKERGWLKNSSVVHGYHNVLKLAISA